MLDFDRALRLDETALELVSDAIGDLTPSAWSRPTPCDGWSVRDLVEHMTAEHLAICGGTRPDGGPASAFKVVAGRWLGYFAGRATSTVFIPSLRSRQSTRTVLAVHLADMVVHRWDLAAALGQELEPPDELLQAAQAVATFVTDPAGPLVGEDRAYRAALPEVGGDRPIDALIRRYGRDPRWRAP
ncbi:TIGR03086 family protein [Sphaerisporangium rufum]|uniref:TIGR03086 family protein n=1 Tax=Sphaerisporangium rufum TaxID=1381558 RepID=A0A919V817_9ACTN|nr:maleylpyruvate isomerase family mycothiol-dependent enzyme [Sphaerisporangium rufum]GII80940.1 TIGR03086 family protein [Sphaerisporangium rufum]